MLAAMPRTPRVPAWMVVVLVSREMLVTGSARDGGGGGPDDRPPRSSASTRWRCSRSRSRAADPLRLLPRGFFRRRDVPAVDGDWRDRMVGRRLLLQGAGACWCAPMALSPRGPARRARVSQASRGRWINRILIWSDRPKLASGCSSVGRACACQAQGRRFETDHPLQISSRKSKRLATSRKNRDDRCVPPSPIHHPNSAAREKLRAYVITYRGSRCDCCPRRSAVKVCLVFRTSWAMCASCARNLERGLRNRARERHPP